MITKSHSLIRKGAARRQVLVSLLLLVSLRLGLAPATTAFAQDGTETRITTLLPGSTECKEQDSQKSAWNTVTAKNILGVSDKFGKINKKICYLEFSFESIPGEAEITGAALRLVQMRGQPNTVPLVINVASIPKTDWLPQGLAKSLADYEEDQKGFRLGVIRSSKAGNDAVDTWTYPAAGASGSLLRPEAKKKYIAFLLSPAASGSGRNYYPTTGDTTNTASNQPRLILTYTVPRSSIPPSPDSQSDGRVAMRSPRAFIPPPPNGAQQKNYTAMRFVDENISSYTAALYGGLTYVIRRYVDKTNNVTEWHLDAQEPLGHVVWSKKLPSKLTDKARLVVNDSGRLTIVSQNRFIVYQLNAADPRQAPSDPLKDATSVPGVKSPHALLAAPDGTLYVIGDTDIYALNPDFQLLWRTGIGTSADARMTLSPDGQFVYAAGLLPDGKKLLAINAQTGSSTEFAFPKATMVFENPVIVRHPDGADYIYIAANSQKSGVLKTLKNVPKGEIGDRIAVLSQVKEKKGLFSQPAPDSTPPKGDLSAKKLYVVWRKDQEETVRLVSINGQSGAIENRDTPAITDSSGNNASVADGSWLWNGGNVVMDGVGNVVFWENGRLFAYGRDNKQLFAGGLSLPEEPELRFGSDGTLYATYETGALLAIVPQYKLGTQSAADIPSPTHLRVDGTVNKNTALSSGGSVIVGGDFKVTQGDTLKISTGVP